MSGPRAHLSQGERSGRAGGANRVRGEAHPKEALPSVRRPGKGLTPHPDGCAVSTSPSGRGRSHGEVEDDKHGTNTREVTR